MCAGGRRDRRDRTREGVEASRQVGLDSGARRTEASTGAWWRGVMQQRKGCAGVAIPGGRALLGWWWSSSARRRVYFIQSIYFEYLF